MLRSIPQVRDAYVRAFRGLPREVWWLSLATLIDRAGRMVVPYLALYVTGPLAQRPTVAGLLIGLWGLGAMCGAQVGGVLTDRIGHRAVQLGSLLGGVVCFLVLARITDLRAFAVGLFVLGLVGESFRPACNAALAAYTPFIDRARAFALNRTAVNLGVTLGPAAGGFLADRDFGLLFRVNAVMWCVSAAVLFLVSRGWQPLEGPLAEPPPIDVGVSDVPRHPSPWRDRVFLMAVGLLFLHCLIFAQHHLAWPLYLNEIAGVSKTRIGVLFAVNTGVILAVEMLLVERLSGRRPLAVVAWGSLVLGVGFGLTGAFTAYAWIVFTVVLWTVGEMLAAPMIVTFVAGRAGPSHRGRYMGVMGIAISASLALSPVLGSWLFERVHPQAPWVLSAALGAITCAGFLGLDRRLRASASP